MDFKKGDEVQLKSGGPNMTVSHAVGSDGNVGCQWFNQDGGSFELKGARFDPATLKKV